MNALPLVVYHTALTTALRLPSRPISSSPLTSLARTVRAHRRPSTSAPSATTCCTRRRTLTGGTWSTRAGSARTTRRRRTSACTGTTCSPSQSACPPRPVPRRALTRRLQRAGRGYERRCLRRDAGARSPALRSPPALTRRPHPCRRTARWHVRIAHVPSAFSVHASRPVRRGCRVDRASSAVFFQDQSKRKETRMILFYVCVHCGTNFTDPKVAES
jgi:hypothetical protein